MSKAAGKRSYAEIFKDTLADFSDGEPQLIGNGALRKELGWDEDRYERVKRQLADEGVIIVGRGRGGTVGLAKAPDAKGVNVFFSYSHADETLKVELLKHLEPLRRLGLIEAWQDRTIKGGEEWDKVISEKLDAADIVLILVSIDFINSKYCYDVELDRALELHARGKARVVPIILRNCLWSHTPFAKLQALPRDAKAIVTWPDRDEALVSVADGIRQIADELLKAR